MNASFVSSNGPTKATGPRLVAATDPMPWGKHKGIPIDQVPRDYLVWALKNMDACRPDSDRHWPEFTAVLESLAGKHAPQKPATLGVVPLCERLRKENVRLEVQGSRVVALDPLPEDLADSLESNRAVLAAVLGVAGGTPARTSGSARLLQGVELRNLAKSWFMAMSRRSHPDAGGSNEAQSAINAGYRLLQELLTKWEASK